MKPFTITTDPGIDDLVALMLLAKLSFDQQHCLVSSFGNAPVGVTGRNAQEFISFVAPQWLYCQGASNPMNGKVEQPWPDYFHGADGVWGVHPKAVIEKVHHLKTFVKNGALISLSPMTDAYRILQSGCLTEATIMGGAFTIPGNETSHAETNIAFDVEAAAHFFYTCKGVNVRVVPLDMTRKVFWSLEMVEGIPEASSLSRWVKQMLLAWFNNYNHDKEKDFNLHDPLAVYLTFFPEKAKWISSGVRVITVGKKRGKTTLDAGNPLCEIAWELHDPASIATDIFRILFCST